MADRNNGTNIQRIGMVIGVRPEKLDEYKQIHADGFEGVRDLLVKYHIHQFLIYLHRMDDGKDYLFATFEYTGHDYKGDMAKLRDEPRYVVWLAQTSACQFPLHGHESWAVMERVFFNP
jgi:L-rhamnose mutarotase